MADVSIRSGTPEDVPVILDLVKTCLGEKKSAPPRTEAYWRWKHEENPFGASPVLVAEAEGQIVGMRAFLRWRWQCGRERVPAVRAVDTVTHPDWRGQGIFTRLTMRLVEEIQQAGVAFVFNTPNKNSRPGYLKMGWTGLGRVSFWLRPLRPLQGLRALLFSGAAPERSPSWLAGRFAAVEALLAGATSPSFRALTQWGDGRYATPRTEAYLRWRYAEVPGFAYRAAWEFDGKDGAAVIFRGRIRSGVRELRLSEVLVAPTEKSVEMGRALVRRVARVVPADYVVAMAAGETPERRVLPWAGFVPLPHLGPHLTVRPLNRRTDAPRPVERSNWRLGIGDLEIF